jgi:pimeloyl-ACP methyl ester carboxylesterase
MDRRSFLATATLAAAGTAAPRMARAATSKNFVLVHGAWHGGWCWGKVAAILRGRGHTVLTPTQTGLGERSHLLSKSITLDTFVNDIVNVLKFEDLKDVILVGHSFGGPPITGTADRVPERIKQLVYLDAAMLQGGQSVFSLLPPELVAARRKAAEETSGGVSIPPPPAASFGISDPAQQAWLSARLTPHPFGTYESPLTLKNPFGNGVPMVYISCTDPAYPPLNASKEWATRQGIKMVELKTGHDAMVTVPEKLADMLDADSV